MRLQDGDKLLLIGDSITDCGRQNKKDPEDMGSGYASQVKAQIEARYPERAVRVWNMGISGNRVTDLAVRWGADVLDLQPTWLSIMIGINDVWRQFDRPFLEGQVYPELFRSTYRSLLEQARPRLQGLVLMTPYFLDTREEDPMRAMMDRYGGIVAELAREFDAVYVDTQQAFLRYLAHRPTQTLCWDRVHPNATGHAILCNAFLEALLGGPNPQHVEARRPAG